MLKRPEVTRLDLSVCRPSHLLVAGLLDTVTDVLCPVVLQRLISTEGK
jgi:hypothetical protein